MHISLRSFKNTAWPGGVTVRESYLQSRGCRFDSRLFRCQVTTLGNLLAHICLSQKAVIWYRYKTGKVLADYERDTDVNKTARYK